MYITEHLTPFNKSICTEARNLFSSNCVVRTESCKIFIDIDGKSNRVSSIEDVRKLFVKYCERIGNIDNYTFTPPSTTTRTHSCYVPKTYASFLKPTTRKPSKR